MPQIDCPSRIELDSFQAGNLNEPRLSSLESHVEGCSTCQRALETVIGESADSVLAALLTDAEPDAFATEASCRTAVERVTAMARELSANGGEDLLPLPVGEGRGEGALLPVESIREYQLLAKLGEGGMGAVYKALHTRLDKVVALKVLPAERMRDTGAVARFQREMKAVGKLDHPNIVRAMDAGEEAGMHFLVMEYVEGLDLSQLAKLTGPLPIADACELVRQAALGLAEAHEHGMVHRDIKPSNLILAKPRKKKGEPTVKILDLGLALLSEALAPDAGGLTTSGQMMGTIDYMAPEQGGDSHQVDIRADIYSLGATLYKLLTGVAPFAGEKFDTPVKKLMALATQSPNSIRSLRPDVPAPLAQIIERMLAKNPADRFATPEELIDALAPFCTAADLSSLSRRAHAASITRGEATSPLAPGGRGVGGEGASAAETGTHARSSPSGDTAPTIDLIAAPLSPRGRGAGGEGAKPRPPRVAALGSWTRRNVAIACGGLVLATLLGVIFYIQTGKGTIQIEINDPAIQVVLDGKGQAIIQGADKKHEIKVYPGSHGLTITRGDFSFDTTKFELQRKGTFVLKVIYLPGKIEVADAAGKLLDDRPLRAYALQFDGQDDYVELPTLKFEPAEAFTMEVWSEVDNLQDSPQLLHYSGIPGRRAKIQIGIPLGPDRPNLMSSVAVGPAQRPADSPEYASLRFDENYTSGWQHVALCWSPDGSTSLYWNGRSCPTPAILDRSKSWPTGTSSMIGANPKADGTRHQFLQGTVRRVRFSKGVRYQMEFQPESDWEADADTLALYRFDEGAGDTLYDTSGNNHHGKIVGAKWVSGIASVTPTFESAATAPPDAAGQHVSALDFSAQLSERTAHVQLGEMIPSEIKTVEMYVTPHTAGNQDKVRSLLRMQGLELKQRASQWIWLLYTPDSSEIVAQPGVDPGQRTHLAAVTTGGELRLFLDGRLIGKHEQMVQAPSGPRDVTLGGYSYFDPGTMPFEGTIDEVRISKVARYDANFRPPLAPFENDSNTLALYHFHEGQGEELKDSSGNGHHGKIVGAKWVRVDDGGASSSSRTRFTNSLGMEFALVPKGKSWLGGGGGKPGDREVEFRDDFFIGVYPVTQEEWEKVTGTNAAHYSRNGFRKEAVKDISDAELKRFPVEGVSYADVQAFLAQLNERANEADWVYRLPTSDEWEYACRGGPIDKAASAFHFYVPEPTNELPPDRANYAHVGGPNRTVKVGQYPPNKLGIHDMHGNVLEWCSDAGVDPKWGDFHVARGSSWNDPRFGAAQVLQFSPGVRYPSLGLRVVRARKVASAGFAPMFTDSDLTGWRPLRSRTIDWTNEAGTITGRNRSGLLNSAGVLESQKSYRDFHFRCEVLAGPSSEPAILFRDTGGLVAGSRRGYALVNPAPTSPTIAEGWGYGSLYADDFQVLLPETRLAPSAEKDLGIKTGDWYRLEIIAQGETVEIRINGKQTVRYTSSEPALNRPGNFALRCGAGSTLAVRNVEIKELPAANVADSTQSAGWHGWPADAPPPAIAPFDAAQAKQHQDDWARHLGLPVEWENSLGMKFRLIPPGEFTMGATQAEIDEGLETVKSDKNYDPSRIRASGPQHLVILTQPMYLAAQEVTQSQYEAIMGTNPSAYAATGGFPEKVALVEGLDTSGHPVDGVSWNDAAEFCAKLSQRERLSPRYFRAGDAVTALQGNGYRLPSEATWEFACRAGTAGRYWSGEREDDLTRVAWYGKNSGQRTHPGGELPPNSFGLFDIHGNVMEWCQDWWEPEYYRQFGNEAASDPTGPTSGTQRTARGGGWGNFDCICRSATRHHIEPTHRSAIIGFRVALSVEAVRELTSSGGYALEFNGKDSYVELPTLKYDGSHPITIEAWATPLASREKGYSFVVENVDDTFVNDQYWPAGIGLQQRAPADGAPNCFGAWVSTKAPPSGQNQIVGSQKQWSIGRPAHLALQLNDGRAQFYIDGILVEDRQLDESHRASNKPFVIGKRFGGQIREVRVSKIARYAGDFAPQNRAAADEHTLALYHFDEGTGTELKDSSGNNHHGKIVGAKWVRFDPVPSTESQTQNAIEPLNIPEPPPLAEWLKGRTILTVAQDGSGQFKSIQAALDALRPGQVVKVLDAGPYYERLTLESPPADSGLISDASCVIELKELKRAGWKSSDGVDVYDGHLIKDANEYRISGIHFVFPKAGDLVKSPGGFVCGGCRFERPNGVVLENCRFEGRCDAPNWDSVTLNFLENGGLQPCVIRECLIEGGLRLDSRDSPASVVVTRNYLVKITQNPRPGLKLFGSGYDRVAIRQNILDGAPGGYDLALANNDRIGILEISNNVLTSRRPILVRQSAPSGRVVIQNNLCTKPGIIELHEVTREQADQAFRTWQLGHNCYPRLLAEGDVQTPFPEGEGDVPAQLTFLSYEPTHPDYLRLPVESPLQRAGASGAWPSYIGALPPGPAPKDGDWFTRLRGRWRASADP